MFLHTTESYLALERKAVPTLATCDMMDLEDVTLSEMSPPQKSNPVRSHLYEARRVVKIMETESRGCLFLWGEGRD